MVVIWPRFKQNNMGENIPTFYIVRGTTAVIIFGSPSDQVSGSPRTTTIQGFMQDTIIASHTWFGGHMWMLTVKPVYKLSNVPYDLKWAINTHKDTIYTHFQGKTNNIYSFGRPFLLLHFFTCSPIFLPVHICFYRLNDGWTGLCIKLCMAQIEAK